jgi:peptide chain release factor 2
MNHFRRNDEFAIYFLRHTHLNLPIAFNGDATMRRYTHAIMKSILFLLNKRGGSSAWIVRPKLIRNSRIVNGAFAPAAAGTCTHRHVSSTRRSASPSSTTASAFDQSLIDARRQVEAAFELYEKNVKSSTPADTLRRQIADLEQEQLNDDFWSDANNKRATVVTLQLSQFTRLLSRLEQWDEWKGDCTAALEMIQENVLSDKERELFISELETTSKLLLDDSKRFELELLLSGPYDSAPARILLTAGAGGTESNEFVQILYRMYARHANAMGYTVKLEDSQEGEVVGYKSLELLIEGTNAYGWFQGEKGAHRLVRLSPYNANNKRQTTFAGVDVAPDILNEDDLKDIDIPDKDLEITAMRSGGAGGQVSWRCLH